MSSKDRGRRHRSPLPPRTEEKWPFLPGSQVLSVFLTPKLMHMGRGKGLSCRAASARCVSKSPWCGALPADMWNWVLKPGLQSVVRVCDHTSSSQPVGFPPWLQVQVWQWAGVSQRESAPPTPVGLRSQRRGPGWCPLSAPRDRGSKCKVFLL